MTRRVADLNSRVKTAQANITLIQVQKMIVGPSFFLWRSRQSWFKPIVYLSLIHDSWAKPLNRCLSQHFEGGYVVIESVMVVVIAIAMGDGGGYGGGYGLGCGFGDGDIGNG